MTFWQKEKFQKLKKKAEQSTIEDVDILRLAKIKKKLKQDIAVVYKFLECASRNHLRAFSRNLEMRNSNYVPQYISKMITKKSSMQNMNNVVSANGMQCQNQGKCRGNREEENGFGNGNCYELIKNSFFFLSLFHRQIMTLSFIRQMKIVEINFDLI